MRNSVEIIFLMSCLYTDLSVLDKSARSNQISGRGVSHRKVDGSIGCKDLSLRFLCR